MYQSVTVIGFIGSELDTRYTPQGKMVTNFSLASNRQYTGSDGEKVKETMWFKITAWGRLAETCNQYIGKGSKVHVEGRLTPIRIWNKNDGTPAADYELTANTVTFLDSKE